MDTAKALSKVVQPVIYLVLAVAFVSPSYATEATYTYTGEPFTGTIYNLTGTVTLSAPLPDSFTGIINLSSSSTPALEAFSFTARSYTWTNLNVTDIYEFQVTETTSTGLPEQWYIGMATLLAPALGVTEGYEFTSLNEPTLHPTYPIGDTDVFFENYYGVTVASSVLTSDSAGTWSTSSIAPAPPSTVPEPGTLLLLCPGLAGLWVWGRKKFKYI